MGLARLVNGQRMSPAIQTKFSPPLLLGLVTPLLLATAAWFVQLVANFPPDLSALP